MSPAELRIGGLARLSTCDWPGQLVATIFTQGCPWDCHYCHNPDLIPACAPNAIPWREVVKFLETRRGLLDGVVFSGGEPTLQKALPDAVAQLRKMGFRIGLHSGGPYPERFRQVLPLLDWVGFDVKAPFAEYEQITGVAGSGTPARESLIALIESGVPCDIRTTVQAAWLNADAIARLRKDLAGLGVHGRLQEFRAAGCRPDRLPTLPVEG